MNRESDFSKTHIADVIDNIRKKGVSIWSENRQIRYKGPKGAIDAEEFDALKCAKDTALLLLEGGHTTESLLRSAPSRQSYRAPLTFSQRYYWKLLNLDTSKSSRDVAAAIRLSGRLNVDALRKSLTHVVRRHDALRTRVVFVNRSPMQEIVDGSEMTPELRVDDLRPLPDYDRETALKKAIEEEILAPFDLTVGPVYSFRLLRIQEDENVLVASVDHLVSDAFSLNILVREILTAYRQAVSGQNFELPHILVQFGEFAIRQRQSLESWLQKHGGYWGERMVGYRRPVFPGARETPSATETGWTFVPVQIGTELKTELQAWCRLNRTTLAMCVFTAFVGLVMRWCQTSEVIVQFQINGRTSSRLENSIGYFASVLYLRLSPNEDYNSIDLIRCVTQEYCIANEHADAYYLGAQVPQPDFTQAPWFNWVVQESVEDCQHVERSADALACSWISFPHPALKKFTWDNDPEIVLFESRDYINGGVYFPLHLFRPDVMEVFARALMLFLRTLLKEPEKPLNEVSLEYLFRQ